MADDSNLFYMVMEADDEELQPFSMDDVGTEEAPAEATQNEDAPQEPDNGPPSLEENTGDDLSFPGVDDGGDTTDTNNEEDTGDDNNDNATENNEDEKLSEKANAVLNKDLYDKFIQKNSEIEEVLDNLQKLSAAIPFSIVKEIDTPVIQLKSALDAGKNYVIEKFVDTKYGGNLLYYKKLEALYTLLMDKINSNLKKADTDQSK
jgi:hypothetical protein